jgi:hypothetical protein
MRLADHNCERILFYFEIPFDKNCWTALATLGKRKSRTGEVRKILVEKHKGVDFHYHFSARKITGKKPEKIRIDINVVSHKSRTRLSTRHPFVKVIDKLEHWLFAVLPRKNKHPRLAINWSARFNFNKKEFEPIIGLPFKNPLDIPDEKKVLGELSISGLKVEFENSTAGLSRVYIEAFPQFLTVNAVFLQRLELKENFVTDFLIGAEGIAGLFVRRKSDRNE